MPAIFSLEITNRTNTLHNTILHSDMFVDQRPLSRICLYQSLTTVLKHRWPRETNGNFCHRASGRGKFSVVDFLIMWQGELTKQREEVDRSTKATCLSFILRRALRPVIFPPVSAPLNRAKILPINIDTLLSFYDVDPRQWRKCRNWWSSHQPNENEALRK